MKKSRQRTKGSHYVTRKYLDGFSQAEFGEPGNLWTYERKVQLEEPKLIPCIDLCKKNLLYESIFLKVNELEDQYAELEGKFLKIFQTKISKKKPLNKKEMDVVKKFVNSMSHRTLSALDNLQNFESRVIDLMQNMVDQFNIKRSEQLEQIKKLSQGKFMFAHSNKMSLEGIGERFDDIAILEITDIAFGRESFFVTSDNPVSIYDFTMMNSIYGIPPGSKTSEITFPLNSKFCLFGNNIGISGYLDADHNMVQEVNNRTMNYSRKYFFAADKMGERFINSCISRWRQSLILNYLYL